MLIRDAHTNDTVAILRIIRQMAAYSDDDEYGPESSNEQLLTIIEDCKIFVLDLNGQVVGVNAVRIIDLSECTQSRYRKMGFIMAFGIEGTQRRKGYGSALFEHMRKWLIEENVSLLSLNVSASNETAQAFYRRMGLVTRSMQMEQTLEGSITIREVAW